jgi:HPt (histidine-containing phosphotransfer) domain-containing protein
VTKVTSQLPDDTRNKSKTAERPSSAIPVLDALQLNRRTNGNPRLQVEVLSLFMAEVERLMRQVEDTQDAQIRGDRLRALIGVARNTGATRLAHEARALETQIADENPDLAQLRQSVAETFAFIRRSGV